MNLLTRDEIEAMPPRDRQLRVILLRSWVDALRREHDARFHAAEHSEAANVYRWRNQHGSWTA